MYEHTIRHGINIKIESLFYFQLSELMQILLRKDAKKWVHSFISFLTRESKYSDITEAIEKDLDELRLTGKDQHFGITIF